MNITIAIPTYNRVEKLLVRVAELLPQMNEGDVLLISDNATEGFNPKDYPVLGDGRVKVVINDVNVGGNANFIKCFERCETEWMWLLSDDDMVLPEALNHIRNEIKNNNDSCVINFRTHMVPERIATVRCSGLASFIDANDGFGNTLLISNNVYSVNKFKANIFYSYVTCGVNAPHLAPVLKFLEQGGVGVYSAREVVVWQQPDINESWCLSPVYNLLFLVDILAGDQFRCKLRRVIARGLAMPEFLALQLTYSALLHDDYNRTAEFLSRILHVYSRFGSPLLKARIFVLRALFCAPKPIRLFSLFAAAFAHRLTLGRPLWNRLQKKKFGFYI